MPTDESFPHDPVSENAGDARALFEREIPTVQALVDSLARRYGLDGDEADSFRSEVMERLLEDDCAVLRRFTGRSSLKTYLAVVVANLYRDRRTRVFGRWRPSAAARRLGPAAILLDAAMNRSGHPLEEAVRVVAARGDVDEDEATLRRWAAELPRKAPRRFVSVDRTHALPDGTPADQRFGEEERASLSRTAERALEEALGQLPEEDQVILRLHFWEGLTLAAVARTLEIEQKPLYRRVEANLRRLRAVLEKAGIGPSEVKEVLPL